ncbi:GtrA family protein [Pseudomonas putida]
MSLARFGLAGVANTLLDALVFNLLTAHWLGVPPLAAAVVSGSVAMLNGFVLHQWFTFRVAGTPWRRRVLFVVLTATSVYLIRPWLMATVMVWGAAHVPCLAVAQSAFVLRNLAWLVAVVLVMLVNYLGYRYWVFSPVGKASGRLQD